jgi:hypothetical protein
MNKGKVTIDDWLPKKKDLLIVSVEANPYLNALFRDVVGPFDGKYWSSLQESEEWGTCNLDRLQNLPAEPPDKDMEFAAYRRKARERCRRLDTIRRVRTFQANKHRLLVVPGAVASTSGSVMDFHFSATSDDTASRFKLKSGALKVARQVISLRLDEILARVPERLVWDTLKIDVQGADVDALISTGSYIENFRCVLGEFQAKGNDSYEIPKDVILDPRPFLEKHGFVMAVRKPDHGAYQIWVNTRFHKELLAGDYMCQTYDMHGLNRESVNRAFGGKKPVAGS